MPFLPDQYHQVAKSLSEKTLPTGEGRYRTIAGRAYYAAYLATRETLKQVHGLDESYTPEHEKLCNTLAEVTTDPDVRKVGDLLNGLRMLRVRADYRLQKPVDEFAADDAVEDAAAILALLPTIAKRLPRVPNRY
jgi:hypothetical protein